MRIGIDASRANLEEKTGTEWYSFYLIQELKKIIPKNIEVVLYSKEPLQGELAKLPKNWRSKVLHWPPKYLWTQIRLSLEMLKIWSRPNLLFVPAHTIPIIHPRKTVLVVHDIGFEKMKELYGDQDIGYKNDFYKVLLKLLVRLSTFGRYGTTELDYHRWAMRFAIKNAHHIITISEFSKQEINEFYKFSENKISVVHNSLDHETYYSFKARESISAVLEKANKILEKYKISQPYILFTGRLEAKKNIPRLIKAFSILKQKYKIPHKLILIGFPGHKYEDIESNIYKLQLKDDVLEPGYIQQADMNSIMNMADLFVLPSLYEGFGIPILEAMAAGTPVACSNIPPLKEVGDQAATYFNPEDEHDMAEVIFDGLCNHEIRKKIKSNGTKQVKKFSYEKCAQQTWDVINELI